jgi:hypothetical protein
MFGGSSRTLVSSF